MSQVEKGQKDKTSGFTQTEDTGSIVCEQDDFEAQYGLKKRVEAIFRRIHLGHLNIILPAFTFYYLLLTCMHFFALGEDIRYIMMGVSGSAAAIGIFLYAMIHTHRLPLRYTHKVMLPLGILAVANIYIHVYLTQDQIQLTNGALAVMAFGFMVLNPRIYSFLICLTTGAFAVTLYIVPGPYTTHFGFMMLPAIIIGTISFYNRYQTISRQTALTIENQIRARRLAQLNKRIEHERARVAEAARIAELASETKSRFLANTSHELRTPLTGVLGMVDLLYKTKLDDEQTEMLGAVKSSARGLLVVLNDILDFAKLEAGGMALLPEAFKVSAMVKRVTDMLAPEASRKGLALEIDPIQDSDIWLFGDPVRIGQILINLVGNAIKFTETGGVRVIATIEGSGKKRLLTFVVADSGIGISEEDQQSLFERFSQADNKRNRKGGGTGLGLAICGELVDLMKGRISVESVLGDGSLFRVEITLETAEAPEIQEKESDILLVESQPLRLLLAEDNPVNQLLVKKLLNKSGWHLTIVSNGKKALDAVMFNAIPFDLVLMDIQMPEMDGLTALSEIRKNVAVPPPVIALTANTSMEDIETYEDAGFTGFVGKPINTDLLLREIDRAVQKSAAISPPP